MRSFSQRWFLLLPVLVLGFFLVSMARNSWTNYWVLRDGRKGMAVLTSESWAGHGVFAYDYVVNRQEFTGRSQRNWEEEKYRNVGVGGKSVVFFSDSHPWLSSLRKPDAVIEGLPVVLVALGLELLFAITIVNPMSRWAMDTSDGTRREKS